ncbi:MAG: FecR domain-containing protein [Saprospiraceae bacterium]|nr:FecR domain-containing protein [Saprospiraceae bacterium]
MKKLNSILSKSKEIKDFTQLDVDSEWKDFVNKTKEAGLDTKSELSYGNNRLRWAIAGFFILIISIIAIWFIKSTPEKLHEYIVTSEKQDTILLFDGSRVYLGENSSLVYPIYFPELNERVCTLEGRAKFEVMPYRKTPFLVKYREIGIEVLGTVFTLHTQNDTIFIKNITGTIKVFRNVMPSDFRILEKDEIYIYQNGIFEKWNVKDSGMAVDTLSGNQELVLSDLEKKVHKVKSTGKKSDNTKESHSKGRIYLLGDVVTFLEKNSKGKIKFYKKLLFNKKTKVTLNMTRSHESILAELQFLGLLTYKKGDCPDCFLVTMTDID